MYSDPIFQDAFHDPTTGLAYLVGRRLAELFPGRAIIEGNDCNFTLNEYARANLCTLDPVPDLHAQFASWYRDQRVEHDPENGWFEVSWRGHGLDVVLMHWNDGCEWRFWVAAETREVAEAFFAAVCAFVPEVEGEVLVFDGGGWLKSETLFQAIRGSSFENLVLGGDLKATLLEDVTRFFASCEVYDAYNIPWKRGLLLTGPPGNGKTHAVKALVHAAGKPCLYVKSFASDNCNVVETSNMRRVFHRARRTAPCLLVLEDLDALIDDDNRSFFLNEMDGFAENRGVVVIATTNHPERLDPAIIDRPSRFDRRYHFPLPARAERAAYLEKWNASWHQDLRLGDAGVASIAAATEGFSFAAMKELAVASTMAWVGAAESGTMDAVMAAQVEQLRSQISHAQGVAPAAA